MCTTMGESSQDYYCRQTSFGPQHDKPVFEVSGKRDSNPPQLERLARMRKFCSRENLCRENLQNKKTKYSVVWVNFIWAKSQGNLTLLPLFSALKTRILDSLNEELPIKMAREKFQRKWYFFHWKDSSFSPRIICENALLIGQVPI